MSGNIGAFREHVATMVAAHGIVSVEPLWVPKIIPGGTTLFGSRIHSINAFSSAAANRYVNLLRGVAKTKTGNTGGAMTLTTTAINRVSGSFITDGWKAGDRMFILDVTAPDGGTILTLANRRMAVVTAVSALALTFAASTFTAETLPIGAQLYKVANTIWGLISAGSANSYGVTASQLLTVNNYPWSANRPDTNMILGADGALVAQIQTTVLGASEQIEFFAEGGDYA